MKVLVIGGGNMGLTYAEGMAKSTFLNNEKLMIYDISQEKLESLRQIPHFDVYDKLENCLPKADLVFIAVKPFHSEELFAGIKDMVSQEQIFISLMAGVTIEKIQQSLGVKKVVRTMPNLPAQVGKGVTSYTEAKEVSNVELIMVNNLLGTTGKSIRVENQNFIDASTGISGSGPAYVFYFIGAMMDAALEMGFSQEDARLLVSQTFAGAVALFTEYELSPDEWMDRVASKGGTTRAALDSMAGNKVKEFIKEAAFAAYNRAVELGKE